MSVHSTLPPTAPPTAPTTMPFTAPLTMHPTLSPTALTALPPTAPTTMPPTAPTTAPTISLTAAPENLLALFVQVRVCAMAINLLRLASITITGAGAVSCDGDEATVNMNDLVQQLYFMLYTLTHQLEFTGRHSHEMVDLIKLCKKLATMLDTVMPPLVQKLINDSSLKEEFAKIDSRISGHYEMFLREGRYPQDHMTNFVNAVLYPHESSKDEENDEEEGVLRRHPAFQGQ